MRHASLYAEDIAVAIADILIIPSSEYCAAVGIDAVRDFQGSLGVSDDYTECGVTGVIFSIGHIHLKPDRSILIISSIILHLSIILIN